MTVYLFRSVVAKYAAQSARGVCVALCVTLLSAVFWSAQMYLLHLQSAERGNVQHMKIAPLSVRGAMPSCLVALPRTVDRDCGYLFQVRGGARGVSA